MKWNALSPYIYSMIVVFLILVGLFWITTKKLSFKNLLMRQAEKRTAPLLLIIVALIYSTVILWYIITYAYQGVRCLSDLIFNDFVVEELIYVESKNGLLIRSFMQVGFDRQEDKIWLSTTARHKVKKGELITVFYGKQSKVIVSILSASGVELLQKGN